MKISIIMPFYNGWELTHARLYEFYKYLPVDNVEICLVNDCSTDDVSGSISFWQKGAARHKILYRKNEANLGFGGSHNEGAKIATGDVFVFYSNDVVLSGNFIPALVEEFEKDQKILVGNRLIYFPAGWNEFEINGKKRIVPYLEGFFIACTREAWKELGGWDVESYGKFDYEDLDLSTKAISLGYNLIDMQSSFLTHLGGRTIMNMNVDRLAHTKRNREVFIQKWQKFLSEE